MNLQRHLFGLASLACSLAHAQSSIAVFGGLDVGVQRVQSDTAGGKASLTRQINGGSLTSRLGFRGAEDLGGGYGAAFWIEAGFNGDTGTGSLTNVNNQPGGNTGGGGLTFNRRSTVSLLTPVGEFRLGRDAVPVFWNQTAFDPFRTQGSGASINITAGAGFGTAVGLSTVAAGRVSNSIGYFLPPNLGGVYGQVIVATGENPSNAVAGTRDDGNYAGGRLGYAAGSLDVALGYGNATYAAGDITTANLGASYDFGVVKVMGQYGLDRRGGTVYSEARYWLVGATVPAGAGMFRASYAQTSVTGFGQGATLAAFGYIHYLSKRTSIYSAIARIDNRGTGTLFNTGVPVTRPGGQSIAYDVGIRHDF